MNKLRTHFPRLPAMHSVAAGAVLLLSLVGCGPSEEQLKAEAARKAKEAEAARVETLKSKVLDKLKDPESAQFRKIKVLDADKGICGELNAKNQMGGYAGFSAFAVDAKGQAFVLKTMSIEVAKLGEDEVRKLGVALLAGGQRLQVENLVSDLIDRREFPFWKECSG